MYSSAYIRKLEVETAAKLAKDEVARAEQLRAVTNAARERLTPLETRVARLLEDIPAELQRDGLSLPALQAALRGRQGGKAHAGEIGTALRKLGFRRRRQWTDAPGFRALWSKQG